LLAGAVQADWSFTKIISLHHFGSPSENDGWRPEGVVLENAINDKAYYSIGILENSEERTGLVIGYSRVFYQREKFDLTGNFYLSSNYQRLPSVMPVPTIGVRYHLTPTTDLIAETVPVPDESDPYVIFITGINVDL
jgi:hypothetical protein